MKYSVPDKDIAWRQIGDEVLLLHLRSGYYYSLNYSGALIWESLANGESEQAIREKLKNAFTDVSPDQLEEDCRVLLEELCGEELLLAE